MRASGILLILFVGHVAQASSFRGAAKKLLGLCDGIVQAISAQRTAHRLAQDMSQKLSVLGVANELHAFGVDYYLRVLPGEGHTLSQWAKKAEDLHPDLRLIVTDRESGASYWPSQKWIVLSFDKGLLLNADIDGVMAHELGHAREYMKEEEGILSYDSGVSVGELKMLEPYDKRMSHDETLQYVRSSLVGLEKIQSEIGSNAWFDKEHEMRLMEEFDAAAKFHPEITQSLFFDKEILQGNLRVYFLANNVLANLETSKMSATTVLVEAARTATLLNKWLDAKALKQLFFFPLNGVTQAHLVYTSADGKGMNMTVPLLQSRGVGEEDFQSNLNILEKFLRNKGEKALRDLRTIQELKTSLEAFFDGATSSSGVLDLSIRKLRTLIDESDASKSTRTSQAFRTPKGLLLLTGDRAMAERRLGAVGSNSKLPEAFRELNYEGQVAILCRIIDWRKLSDQQLIREIVKLYD